MAVAAIMLTGVPANDGRAKQQSAESNQTQPFPSQPQRYYRPCSANEEDRDSDLCAQWRSDDWSARSYLIGLIGVIGLIFTLLFNLEAWNRARKSGDDTKAALLHAATSASAMVGVATSLKAQSRAYVTVNIGSGIYQDEGHVFEAQPVVLNRGFTTARRLRWRIAADVVPIPPPPDFKYPLPKEIGGGTDLDAQQDGFMTAVIRDRRRLEAAQAQAAKTGQDQVLTVWGYLWYDDVFGKRHRRTFSQQIWWFPAGDRRLDGSYPMAVRGMHLRHNRGN